MQNDLLGSCGGCSGYNCDNDGTKCMCVPLWAKLARLELEAGSVCCALCAIQSRCVEVCALAPQANIRAQLPAQVIARPAWSTLSNMAIKRVERWKRASKGPEKAEATNSLKLLQNELKAMNNRFAHSPWVASLLTPLPAKLPTLLPTPPHCPPQYTAPIVLCRQN